MKKATKRSSNPFYESGNISIYVDDFLENDLIKRRSVDLTITSPPYNLDIDYNSHKDDLNYKKYLDFSKAWLKKVYLLTKPTGRLCLNIPLDKNKGGQQSVYADLVRVARSVGWKYHTTIIWNEQNISRRTAWGSFKSASAPYIIAPVEMIIVMYKKEWKKNYKGKSDITKKEFIEWTNGMWTFNGESKKRIGHPAPFPIELPKRCIKIFSYVGDFVLDPFVGSGTTLIASNNLKRKGIGVDKDRSYCKLAKQRLLNNSD
jgi:site-specific DNA-methyltransferase (adenine-specific)